MAKCYFTGKSYMMGNLVSHAHNKTKRRFKMNLQRVRIRDEKGRIKRVWVSTRAIRAGLVEKP